VRSVERWRGYATSSFILRDADGFASVESPAFRWRKPTPPPDNPKTRGALDALVGQLASEGWALVGEAPVDRWYALLAARLEPAARVDGVVPVEKTVAPPRAARSERPARQPVVRARATRERKPVPYRIVASVSALGLAAAALLFYVLLNDAPRKRAVPTPVPSVRVVVVAKRASWVELRRDSRTGNVVFAGRLPEGRRVVVASPRVWARFSSAGNLDIVVSGKRLPLTGSVDRTFSAPQ